jgi:hypothetical protein
MPSLSHRGAAIIILTIVALLLNKPTPTRGDFSYLTFAANAPLLGVAVNGDARFERCTAPEDPSLIGGDRVLERVVDTTTTTTRFIASSSRVATHLDEDAAALLALETASSPPPQCAAALRLTPSLPSQVGAAWHTAPQAVADQFEAVFAFRVSNSSRVCETRHTNVAVDSPGFDEPRVVEYNTCSGVNDAMLGQARGGDGFAFVVHRSGKGTDAVGATTGSGVGVAGIENCLSVRFDSFSNGDAGDAYKPSVSVHSPGAGAATRGENTRLTHDVFVDFADGKQHTCRITLFPTVSPIALVLVCSLLVSTCYTATALLRHTFFTFYVLHSLPYLIRCEPIC